MNKIFGFLLLLIPALALAQAVPISPDQTVRGNGKGKPYPDTDLILGSTLQSTANQLLTTQPINAQTGTSYAMASADCGSLITFNNASPVAVSLSSATTAGFGSGCTFEWRNLGAGLVTVTPTTSTINGNLTLAIPTNTSCVGVSDGVNYQTTSCTSVVPTTALTGVLAAAQMSALTGDVTNSAGSLATTVGKVNGAAVPTSAGVIGSNSSSQLIAETALPSPFGIGVAGTSGTTYSIYGAAGSNRGIQYDTGTTKRWAINENAVAEGGNNTGSQLAILAYPDSGSNPAPAITGQRTSGPFGDWPPYFLNFVSGSHNYASGITPSSNIFGDNFNWSTNPSPANQTGANALGGDTQLVYAIATNNPISTGTTSQTITVTWTNCCSTGGILAGTGTSTSNDAWVNLTDSSQGAAVPDVINGLVIAPLTCSWAGTASQSGTTLTVSLNGQGTLAPGCPIYNTAASVTTYLGYVVSGTGPYTLSASATISSEPMWSSSWYEVLNVSSPSTVRLISLISSGGSPATGGGTSVSVQPSYVATATKTYTVQSSDAGGYQLQHSDIAVWNPAYYQNTAGVTQFQQHYEQIYTPPDTSQQHVFGVNAHEYDLINRGADDGYQPNLRSANRPLVGDWYGAYGCFTASCTNGIQSYVPGGGSAHNWGTAHTVGLTEEMGLANYQAYGIQPNALVGVLNDSTSSHGGVGYDAYGSFAQLTTSPAPYLSTNGSAVVTVRLYANSGGSGGASYILSTAQNGDTVYIPTACTFDGVTISAGTYTIGNVSYTTGNDGTFTITGTGTGTGVTGCGGTVTWLSLLRNAPFAWGQLYGEWKHGIIATNAKFDTDELSFPGFLADGSGRLTAAALTTAGQITSTASTGTAPLVIASTTNVANLNASSLNGATFASPGAIGGTVASSGNFTTLGATGLFSPSSGMTATGAAISLNVSSNFSTAINTGTSTGNITIGNNTSTSASQTTTFGGADIFTFGTGYSSGTWGLTSPLWNVTAFTMNDTTASGTVTNDAAMTIQAVNFTSTGGASTTLTNPATLYIGAPTCTTVICTNGPFSLYTAGGIKSTGGVNVTGAVIFNANNNASTSINTGTSTSAVHIADGSGNNAVTIGNGTGVDTIAGPLTVSNATLKLTGIAASSAAQTGTLCIGAASLITYDTTTTCLLSSRRWKQDIETLGPALDELMQFRPVTYNLKPEFNPAGLGRQIGLIAEEVQAIDSRLVSVDDDGQPRGVRYMQITALIIKAVQEQNGVITAQAAKIDRQQLEIYGLAAWCLGLTGFMAFRRKLA